jgi:hypothetical protein
MAGTGDVRISSTIGLPSDTLFVGPEFNAFQAAAQGKTLISFSTPRAQPRISLTLAGKDGAWSSPVTGAFGGIAGKPVGGDVEAVVRAMTAWARAEAPGSRFSLRLPPDCFPDPSAAHLENALFREGWRLKQADLDNYLSVGGSGFAHGLAASKRNRLNRLKRSGAGFRTLTPDLAQPAHALIARNRAARGYPMTMSWPQIAALAQAFPDRVRFHAVLRGETMLAAAVVLRVAPSYAYVFYWGEEPAFREESPVLLLADGLMEMARHEGVAILDLGTSTEDSTPNPGLMAFKAELGCLTASKRTFSLDPGEPATR